MRLTARRTGLFLGPTLAVIMWLAGTPEGLSDAAWGTACLMALMATWWATEAIPIPATSLLPLVVLPLIGAGTPKEVASAYADHVVLLLLGGFIVAIGIERWNLHTRIALNVIAKVGTSPRALVFGFMLATALLSMWISNTATTLMMVPIALSAAAALGGLSARFSTVLLLGICYAASIGGVGTPVGTPTNLIARSFLENETGTSIGFAAWMQFGLPTVALLIPAAWWSVTRDMPKAIDSEAAAADVKRRLKELGTITTPEARVAAIFLVVALLWVFRLPLTGLAADLGWTALQGYKGQLDTVIAIFGALLMFLVPAGKEAKRQILDWQEAERLPWGVLVLFGGGIALGRAVSGTGLSEWIGNELQVLQVLPPLLFVAAVVALVIFLTELTSNVATMTTLAPILITLSAVSGVPAEAMMAPAAVAASCAFMLPVATAPNAVVYATGEVPIQEMIRKGLYVNLIGVVVISAIGFWIAPMVL